MEDEKLWYFAYGSNMNPSVLTGRRRVGPSQSKPAFAPGYYLNFSYAALPYKEPSFASLGLQPILPSQPVAHGVVHQITKKDLIRISRTEGGGGHEGVGYAQAEIKVETYDGKIIPAFTLICCTPSHHTFFPSTRYMNLLEIGAAQSGLREDYQNWIKSVPRYVPIPTVRHWIGRILFLSIVIVTCAPVVGVIVVGRLTGKRAPRVFHVLVNKMMGILANVYRFVFRPIFGPGAGEGLETKKPGLD